MKALLVVALALLGIAASEPIRHKLNRHIPPFVRSPVGDCPEHDPANPVYLPDSEDCGFYYECSNGEPVENNCPPDLEFSPSKHVCMDCEGSGCTASIRHCSSNPPPTTTTEEEQPTTTLSFLVRDPTGDCPKHDTNETIFLADTQNCTIYYMCSNGKAIPRVCPPTTVFNPEVEICVSEIDYECPLGAEERTGKLVRKPDGQCPDKDPGMPVYLADTEDCTIYYECSNGVAVENVCPPGLAFNPTLHVCDEPTHAQCKASSTGPSSTSAPTTTF